MNVLKLLEYRKKFKMSQRDVAKALGISQAYYWTWEKGEAFPNAQQILKLCEIFKCSPNDLFGVQGVYQVMMDKWDNQSE